MKKKDCEIKINIFFDENGLSIKRVLEIDFENFLNIYLKKIAK